MPIRIREDGTRVLVITGTGPEPEPPPYYMNKPGIPPGQVPDEVKEQMRQAIKDRRAGRPTKAREAPLTRRHEMAKETPKVEPPPLLIIRGTGPEPEPPPYHMNKPGIPPGQVPDEVKEQMRQARKDRREWQG